MKLDRERRVGSLGSIRVVRPLGSVLPLVLMASAMGQDPVARVKLSSLARISLTEAPPATRLTNAICSLGYAPDGSTLAVGLRDPNTILLLDPVTLAVRGRLEGHLGLVSRVIFMPDAKTLVSSGHDGTVRLWELPTKRERLVLDQFQGNIRGLAISPDGKRIFTGEAIRGHKGTTRAWGAEDGRLLGSMAGDDRGIEDITISRDGSTLATTSRDQTIRLWELTTYTQKERVEVQDAFSNGLAFGSDGLSLVAAFSDKTIRMFDLNPIRPRWKIQGRPGGFLSLVPSADGALVATSDANRLEIWRTSDGFSLGSTADVGGYVNALQFSPDGRKLAVGGLAGLIQIFQVDREVR